MNIYGVWCVAQEDDDGKWFIAFANAAKHV